MRKFRSCQDAGECSNANEIQAYLQNNSQMLNDLVNCLHCVASVLDNSTLIGSVLSDGSCNMVVVNSDDDLEVEKRSDVRPSASELKSGGEQYLITTASMEALECAEHIIIIITELLPAEQNEMSLSCDSTPLYEAVISAVVESLELFLRLIDKTNEAIPTSPTESQGDKQQQVRLTLAAANGGIRNMGFRSMLLSCTGTFFNPLQKVISVSSATSMDKNTIVLKQELIKNIALTLLKATALPNLEVAMPALLTMGCLGQRDSELRSSTGSLLSYQLNALLTNAALRRLDDPRSYAVYRKPTDNLSNKHHNKQEYQNDVLVASLRIIDAAVNAFIDLHSSDDLDYFEKTYRSPQLRCVERLQQCGESFASRLNECSEIYFNNGSSNGVVNSSAAFSEEDAQKMEESLENLERFLAYKEDFRMNSKSIDAYSYSIIHQQ